VEEMTSAHIRFASDILRRLGEELNPSPDQSILELVKNSYDADARECIVELINTEQPGGTVRILDDGDGMDVETIINGWLVIGSSSKSKAARTRLGRIPAGNKGLGRLAAVRLGLSSSIITRPRSTPGTEFSLHIDWDEYDKVAVVEDVELEINKRRAPKGSEPGSAIMLENLKVPISRPDVKRLARSLILLADPFADNPTGFKPTLRAREFADLEALVQNRYFSDAEFHLISHLDQNGKASASLTDWRGNILFTATHADLASTKDRGRYSCPPVRFDLWVFILSKGSFENRSSTLVEVREWLEAFGGVHLYENDLRVMPYGNPGNDWLDMNLRRAQSPEERPSTNTAIGRVAVHEVLALALNCA
jgi:hypothetical protein